jgi:hypothetical protein
MNKFPIFNEERFVPRHVGSLQFQDVIRFDQESLGVQIRYDSPDGVKADVYLYDLGLTDISSDIQSPRVDDFFQQAAGSVLLAAEHGLLLDFEIKDSRYLVLPVTDPEPTYLSAVFYYRQAPGPHNHYDGMRYSHLAVRTDGGYVNKVRYTYPETVGDAQEDVILFLTEWYIAVRAV